MSDVTVELSTDVNQRRFASSKQRRTPQKQTSAAATQPFPVTPFPRADRPLTGVNPITQFVSHRKTSA